MKTFTSLALAALLTLTSFAGEYDLFDQVEALAPTIKTNETALSFMTDDMWLQYIDQWIAVCTATGSVVKTSQNISARLSKIAQRKQDGSIFTAYDTKLFDAGIVTYPNWRMPKCTAKYFETHPDMAAERPIWKAWHLYMQEHCADDLLYGNAPVEWDINVFCENCATGYASNHSQFIKSFSARVTSAVRHYLRNSGKTFVVNEETGSNPVQDEINQFVAALQAPNFAGLKEWMAKVYPDYEWIEPKYMTAQEIQAFRDAIFYGDIPLDHNNSVKLQCALGLDAYNAFIEAYNNDAN